MSTAFTSASFKAGGEIIPRGYQAAKRKENLLAGLSLADTAWQAYMASRNSRAKRQRTGSAVSPGGRRKPGL